MWNSLPDRVVLQFFSHVSSNGHEPLTAGVVMADTVNQFKNRLDKHWANCAVLYDYHVNYNGTGSLFVA